MTESGEPTAEEPAADRPTAHNALRIGHQRVGSVVVIEVVGEVDMDTSPQLDAAVTSAFQQPGADRYVLDLTRVTYLASAGLTSLVNATRRAEARTEPLLVVVDSTRPVIRPIELTGLDTVLRLYHSVDEALGSDRAS